MIKIDEKTLAELLHSSNQDLESLLANLTACLKTWARLDIINAQAGYRLESVLKTVQGDGESEPE